MPLERMGLDGNRTSYPLKCLSGDSGTTISFLVTGLSTSFPIRIPKTGISFRAPLRCFPVHLLSTGCCPNPFSLGLKRFLINLRLAPGNVKTRPLGSNSCHCLSSASPRFIVKNVLITAQRDLCLGNSLSKENLYIPIASPLGRLFSS